MMFKYFGFIFSLLVIVSGICMLYGIFKKWPFLVNPPEDNWIFYSQAFIKKIFGERILIFETIIVALAFIGLGLVGFLKGIEKW